MSQSASDLIMGRSGPPAVKFPTIGTLVKGQIVETGEVQQRDFTTGELKFWKDGNKMMQAVLTIQTDQHDDSDDDGRRRLFVGSRNMTVAIRDAALAAGTKVIEVGGTIAVQYTGDGEAEHGNRPPKLYAAEYKPPAIQVGGSLLSGDQPAQQQKPTSLLADEAPF